MILTDIRGRIVKLPVKTLVLQFLGALSLAFAMAFSMHDLWLRQLNTYHTILEVICIFIALSIFFSTWFTYRLNNENVYILGFGYLMVAIFDSLHTLYFLQLNLTAGSYFDMSTRYWILGRLTEAVVLFMSVQEIKFTLNKWTSLTMSLTFALGISYFAHAYHDYLPILLNENGVTTVKSFLEYVIITIFLMSIYKLKDRLNDDSTIKNKYIYISLLLVVPSETCFAFYASVNSITWTLGHLLKIVSYYFLFKGIFISTVAYPYKRLEIENIKLEESYRKLEESSKELQNLHLQTQTILNAVNSGILMIDTDKNVVLCNRAIEDMFEMRRKDIIGTSVEELNDIINFSARELPDLALRGGEEQQLYEVTINTPGGKKRDLLIYLTAIRNMDDEIIGGISVSTDITEFKKEQQKLQQQEKLALIGQMASGIIHEIKNPLATIKGLSQMIVRKAQVEKVKEYSRVISDSIDDVSRVVSEFLNFAKPKPSVKKEVLLNEVVEAMRLIIETSCYTRNINVVFELVQIEAPVVADASKLKQVILNMCENAIDAMQGVEKPLLELRTCYDCRWDEMTIRIADNGKGMSPEEKAKLGTPFFTTKEKGTGLGMGICNQIISEHGGRIDVESEQGKGTVFTIALPCIKVKEYETGTSY